MQKLWEKPREKTGLIYEAQWNNTKLGRWCSSALWPLPLAANSFITHVWWYNPTTQSTTSSDGADLWSLSLTLPPTQTPRLMLHDIGAGKKIRRTGSPVCVEHKDRGSGRTRRKSCWLYLRVCVQKILYYCINCITFVNFINFITFINCINCMGLKRIFKLQKRTLSCEKRDLFFDRIARNFTWIYIILVCNTLVYIIMVY